MNLLCFECGKLYLVEEFDEHLKTHDKRYRKFNKNKKPLNKGNKGNKGDKDSTKDKNGNKKIDQNIQVSLDKKNIDDNLGFKKCEYCTNMVENLANHLRYCKAKKMIDEENEKYKKDLEKKNKEEEDKEKAIAEDEEIAKDLQNKINNDDESQQTNNQLRIITKLQK